jgi:hypothetical protein
LFVLFNEFDAEFERLLVDSVEIDGDAGAAAAGMRCGDLL